MHIPDGYLGPPTFSALWAVMAPVWLRASRKMRDLDATRIPHVAMASAFSLAVMIFALPLPGGTTGHISGAAVVAILLGPWACVLAVSIALAIQAMVFGDGGITSLGANCFNMALVGGSVGYWSFRLIAKRDVLDAVPKWNHAGPGPIKARELVAASVAGYLSVNASALFTALELGVQPLIHRAGLGGRYFPYTLDISVAAVMLPHLTFIGFLEAGVTAMVFGFVRGLNNRVLPMGKIALLVLVAGCLMRPSQVMAHEFWIEGRPPELHLVFGHGSSKAEFDPGNVKKVFALDPKGARLNVAIQTTEKAVAIRLPESTSVVVAEVDNGYWSKTIYGWKRVGKTKASRVIESIRSVNYAKAILCGGAASITPVEGVDLDLVPKEDPYGLNPGDALVLQAIFQGKTLSGVEVTDGEHQNIGTTDKDGCVRVTVKKGRQCFAVTYKVLLNGDPDADFLSITATLVFEVS